VPSSWGGIRGPLGARGKKKQGVRAGATGRGIKESVGDYKRKVKKRNNLKWEKELVTG